MIRLPFWKTHSGYSIETELERGKNGRKNPVRRNYSHYRKGGQWPGPRGQQYRRWVHKSMRFDIWIQHAKCPQYLTDLSLPPTLYLTTKESWNLFSSHYSSFCNWLPSSIFSSHHSHDLQVQISTLSGKLPTDSNLTSNRTQSKPIIYFPQISRFPYF